MMQMCTAAEIWIIDLPSKNVNIVHVRFCVGADVACAQVHMGLTSPHTTQD